jgi:hypothetical protein
LNSINDTSFNTDFGPWSGWDISIPDPGLYQFDFTDQAFDFGDGWGLGLQEDVSTAFTDAGWGSDVETPNALWPDTNPDGVGYTATVSFSTPLITYPEVWYAILQPNFVLASVTVSVNNPPVGSALNLTITDGTVNGFNPEAGQFGGGNSYGVVIPEGKTSATIDVNASGDSVSTATSRTFSITSWAGGGYKPDGGTPALDISATAAFTIEAYVATISLQQPGIWTYDGTDWSWAGPEDTGDWTWDEGEQRWDYTPAEANAVFTWSASTQQWSASNTDSWDWNTSAQRWVRSTADPSAADTKPSDPPAGPPSPIPSEVTAAGKSYTVVAQASVDKPAIPNGANDLEIDLQDFDDDGTVAVGTLVIPAISMMFAAGGGTQLLGGGSTRRNRPHGAGIQRMARGSTCKIQGIGLGARQKRNGRAALDQRQAAHHSKTAAPTPPDAARWIYSNGWSGTAHWPGGTAPDFTGLLSGSLTYHM